MTASSNFGNVFSVLVASAFLPFLPMLPIQLLTVNLLYDFSQASIPWDDMDPEYLTRAAQVARRRHRALHGLHRPDQLDLRHRARSSLMWYVFGANAPAQQSLFQSGWFIESLLTQTLIVHMIRTAKVPFIQSRATWPVLADDGGDHRCGAAAPLRSRWAAKLGLVPLPAELLPLARWHSPVATPRSRRS